MKTKSRQVGFTIIELLVVVSIIGLLLSLLIPAVGKARDSALTTQSLANLRNLASACGSYAADWTDRQPTWIFDDFAAHIKNNMDLDGEKNYQADTGSCPPSIIVGFGTQIGTCKSSTGKGGGGFGGGGGGGGGGMQGGVSGIGYSLWGIWTQCEAQGMPKNWGIAYSTPMILATGWGTSSPPGDGAWRMPNSRCFNQYVGGKYYDKVFFSPKDKFSLDLAQPAFEKGDDFTNLCHIPGHGIDSTYCFSPAAMYSSDVFGSKKGCISFKKSGLPASVFKSPASGQAAFPELKTRMIEHVWLQNKEGPEYNPNWATSATQPPLPFFFNQCTNSAPATMFFDGHISLSGCADSMDQNAQVIAGNIDSTRMLAEKGLFASKTLSNITGGPWGDYGGYFTGPEGKTGANFNYDTQVNTSYHVFTLDGILGRDFIISK